MKRRTSFALLTISSLSLATSVTTLFVVLVGAKKMQEEVGEVKFKTTSTIDKLKAAIADLDI